MPLTLVNIDVKPECAEKFVKITEYNVENTRKESGTVQFALLHSSDDPDRYVLYEHFMDDAAVAAHKETEHYKKWAAEVADYMKGPRTKQKFDVIK